MNIYPFVKNDNQVYGLDLFFENINYKFMIIPKLIQLEILQVPVFRVVRELDFLAGVHQ